MLRCATTLFSKRALAIAIAIGAPCSVGLSQDATSTSPTKRVTVRDERPDTSRGWMIVSKQSYWPLCYEALEQIESTKALIGKGNPSELADAFEKSAAWLSLAASATNLGGQGGVQGAGDLMDEVAEELRDKDSKVSDERLNDLVTLGLVCVAKSHVIRAAAPDLEARPTKSVAALKQQPKSSTTKEIDKEIAAEKRDRDVAQYRYDTLESRRHLVAAQEYLKAAVSAGKLELKDESVLTAVPEPPAATAKPGELADYTDSEIRPLIKSLDTVVASHLSALFQKLGN